MTGPAPERLRRAVEQLGIAPDDEVLEIGPGAGASVATA
jgi:16S rRNA A1518/A1519 N6-dimethyltransferase RsmA/KsgA/DIM1 with predicted DNA glycosylase/AP lyase activity